MRHYSLYKMLFVAASISELITELVLGSLLVVLHVFSYTAALCRTREQAVAQCSSPAAMLSPGATDTSQASQSRVLCCRWQAN